MNKVDFEKEIKKMNYAELQNLYFELNNAEVKDEKKIYILNCHLEKIGIFKRY